MTASLLLLATSLVAAPAPRLGAEVVIAVPTEGPVVAVLGEVRVASRVDGDVISLAGDVTLEPGAVVSGDVVAVGGSVNGRGIVQGRTVSTATLGFMSGWHHGAGGVLPRWGVRLLRLGGWLLMVGLVISLRPGPVRRCGGELKASWVRSVAAGLLSLMVWLVLMVLGLALAASPLGLAALAVLVVGALIAKIMGIAAVAWWVALAAVHRLPRALRPESVRTGLAVALLILAGGVPFLGDGLWIVANVAGIGAFVIFRLRRSPLLAALPGVAAR